MKLSQRQKRVITALLAAPIMREDLDALAGCSNGPELVAELRRKGFSLLCERVERYDRDGNVCYPGRYFFTQNDKKRARVLLSGHAPSGN